MELSIRKLVIWIDETRTEMGQPVDPPVTRVIAAAVVTNPYAGRYVEDLSELAEASVALSTLLAGRAAAQLGPGQVHSSGKAGIVGVRGELEHVAAMFHPKFGNPLRDASGGGKAIIPSAKKRGGPEHRLMSRCTTRTPPSSAVTSMRPSCASSTPPPTTRW